MADYIETKEQRLFGLVPIWKTTKSKTTIHVDSEQKATNENESELQICPSTWVCLWLSYFDKKKAVRAVDSRLTASTKPAIMAVFFLSIIIVYTLLVAVWVDSRRCRQHRRYNQAWQPEAYDTSSIQ